MESLKIVQAVMVDRRNLTLIFFMAVALGISWATVSQIEFNYQLEQEARSLRQEVAVLELQNRSQELRNEFYQTDYYQDLSARDLLGVVDEGESIIVLNSTQLEKTAEAIEGSFSTTPTADSKTGETSNLEQWVRFFRGMDPL